ncbi:hypothetical protein [Actinomadura flavalba]|uniref:hypothetical protein n=1 Tax=Actinomadura flavalba TaxID=1120938 RepID=UPI000373D689|nr:hypothetical protein [Actinomadura flavalba]
MNAASAGRTRWTQRVGGVLAAAVLGSGGFAALGAPAAQAQPSGCTFSWIGGFSVRCEQGDGRYRAKMTCSRTGVWPQPKSTVYGDWATAGPGSVAKGWCPAPWYPLSGGVDFE